MNEQQTAEERLATIYSALSLGYPELADAIECDTRCMDCGGFVDGDGATVDLTRCCFHCKVD